MNQAIRHYHDLADLLDYPDEGFSDKIKLTQQFLSKSYPHASVELEPFASYMTSVGLLDQQELFIRSFDVQSLTTLDVGYVIFGDDYKRGELLVNLNREHKAVQNDCGNELADYLPNVLRLLPKIHDDSFLLEFVEKILVPALQSMIRAFAKEEVVKKEAFFIKKYKTIIDRPTDQYCVYQHALKALYITLKSDFNFHVAEAPEKQSDFLRNISTEIILED
ncbi:MAG: hypothetical protein HKN76_16180 [Saprospiraceae bacterium]|nr:hypothetical protein [Saprospiraceae bacterium]